MKKISLTLLTMIPFTFANGQMIISTGQTAQQMAVTITGGGVVVSNAVLNCSPVSSGIFTCIGNCDLNLSGGIILTSGSATLVASTNTGTGQGISSSFNAFPDPQLASISSGSIFDVCVLKFDFIAASDSVEFSYVFGSDEYSDYANTMFNDVFGFFLSGPGITGYQNIALVPGTTMPVSINNVNNGGPVGHGILPPGPCMNCAYFIDNSAPPTLATAYDGVTTVLKAVAGGLIPGQTYELKLGICDVNDAIFDSGALIETGSLRIPNPAWIFAAGQKVTGNLEICAGGKVEISAPFGFTYLWNTGATTQSIFVNQAGQYNVTITGSNSSATASSEIVFTVISGSSIPAPAIIQNGNTLSSTVTQNGYQYTWTKDGNLIAGANGPTLNITQTGCYAVTIKDVSGCLASSSPFCTSPLSGIVSNFHWNDFSLSPNPVITHALLSLPYSASAPFELILSDSQGRQVLLKKDIKGRSLLLDCSHLSDGLYIGKIQHSEFGTQVFKLIKQ